MKIAQSIHILIRVHKGNNILNVYWLSWLLTIVHVSHH